MWEDGFNELLDNDKYTLQELCQFIISNISNKRYYYEADKGHYKHFIIEFFDSQVPHLMGLQHIGNLPEVYPTNQLKKMLNGEWSFKTLSDADNAGYKQNELRVHGVKFLYLMFHRAYCETKFISPSRRDKLSRYNVSMVFTMPKTNKVYILGLRRTQEKEINGCIYNVFNPVSLIIDEKGSSILNVKSFPFNVVDVKVEHLR